MKRYLIFAAILLFLGAPYIPSSKINYWGSSVAEVPANTINPCPKKTLTSVNSQCSFSQFGVTSELSVLGQMRVLLRTLTFCMTGLTLCSGFKSLLYKPPKR